MHSVLGSARALASWKRELEQNTTWLVSFYRACRQVEGFIPVDLQLTDEPLLGRVLLSITRVEDDAQVESEPEDTMVSGSSMPRMGRNEVEARNAVPKPLPQQPVNKKGVRQDVPLVKLGQVRATRNQLERAAHGSLSLVHLGEGSKRQTPLEFPKGHSMPPVSAASGSDWVRRINRGLVPMPDSRDRKTVQSGGSAIGNRPSPADTMPDLRDRKTVQSGGNGMSNRLSLADTMRADVESPVSGDTIRPLSMPLDGPKAPITLLNWLVKKNRSLGESNNHPTPLIAKKIVDAPVDEDTKQTTARLPAVETGSAARDAFEMLPGVRQGHDSVSLPEMITPAGKGTAPILTAVSELQQRIWQSEVQVAEGDDLHALSAKIKQILDDEARRYGIDV